MQQSLLEIKEHILKADIFTLEKPDISTLGLQKAVIHQLKCLCDKPFKMSCFLTARVKHRI
ncbi:hypothetical protein FSC17_12630 [Acinetobacter indicus]|nr:hypothetical protein FSC17_12630 [Acinetobacter indicus]